MTSEYRQPHEYPRPQEYSPPQVIDADFRVTETGEVVKGGDNRRRGGLIGTLLAALVFIGSKAGYILSALKGVKFLGTGATALLSVGS